MTRPFRLLAAAALVALSPTAAQARHHPHHRSARAPVVHGWPSAWCGAFMASQLGIRGQLARQLWLARNWARFGRPAGGPAVGVIVVWPHHVGRVVGRDARGQWIVLSGNDGHAVRSRPRSVAGAIAFRWAS